MLAVHKGSENRVSRFNDSYLSGNCTAAEYGSLYNVGNSSKGPREQPNKRFFL